MAVESEHTPPNRGRRPGDIELLLDEVQDLTWALLDEHISGEEFARLEQVLTDEEVARQTYLNCVQLHVDLYNSYAEERTTTAAGAGGSPLLGFLDEALPPLGGHSSQPDDAGC